MPDYSKSIIYVIRCEEKPELVYVGSTTNFTQRKYNHKQRCGTDTSKLYTMIQENGGWKNFIMIEHSKFPCENTTELKKEEERVRLEIQAHLNTRRCYRTEEEIKVLEKENHHQYYIDNKEHIQNWQKQYNQENAEKIKEQKRKYNQENLEIRRKYRQENAKKIKEYKRQYRQENAEKIKEYKRQYRQNKKYSLTV